MRMTIVGQVSDSQPWTHQPLQPRGVPSSSFYFMIPSLHFILDRSTEVSAIKMKPMCTDNNWSPASAWWFLASLAIACLAHPRGSVVFYQAGRIWRLSPLYLFFENIAILYRLYSGVRAHSFDRHTLRLYSYAILALREGSAWSQKELDGFFDEKENARFGRESNGDAEVFMDEWFTIGSSTLSNYRLGPEKMQQISELLDLRSSKNLEQVADYEKGPTVRTLLWLPVIQNLAKACLVSGAPFTIFIGAVYIFSFFLIEALLFLARAPLGREQRPKALKLLREWADLERIPRPVESYATERRMGIRLRPKEPSISALMIILAGLFNIVLLFKILGLNSSLLKHALRSPVLPFCKTLVHPTTDTTLGFLQTPLGILVSVPICVLLQAMKILLTIWISLWALVFPILDAEEPGRLEFKRIDLTGYLLTIPAIIASVLAFVVYWGFGPEWGLIYDCSTTSVSSIYSFLG
jgi:hypothetical protein